MLKCLVFVLSTLSLTIFCDVCEKNESCVFHDGNPGIIKLSSDCKHFMLSRSIRFQQAPCGYIGNAPLVCCPNESPLRLQNYLMRKVIEECKKFGVRPKDTDGDLKITSRIMNGEMSDLGESPHFASLGYRKDNDEISFDCGGALISENFVLTAAHCCTRSHNPKIVRLGKVNCELKMQSSIV